MIRPIPGGTFDTDKHEYRSDSGVWVPSLTGVLSSARYVCHDGIDPVVLRNAADRGRRCHWHTECFDSDGDFPPPWTPHEERIRFEAYREWKTKEKFIPERIEYPLIFSIYGMMCGCTIDRVGTLDGQPAIVELKFTYSPAKYWGIQIAGQEIAVTGSSEIGKYRRVVCHVNSKGKAQSIPFNDPYDAQRFIFALGVTWTRIELGEIGRQAVIEEE